MITDLSQLSPLLIELLLKSGIVVAIGFALVLAFRNSTPEWKHRILLRAFGVAMVIPLLLMLPRWEILPEVKSEAPPVLPSAENTPDSSVVFSSPLPVEPKEAADTKPFWRPSAMEIFALLWLAGSAFFLLRMAMAGSRLRSLARSAKRPSQRIRNLFTSIQLETGVQGVRLLVSDSVVSPFTHGLTHPGIYLPNSSENRSDEELAMIFRHELAHVKRRDALAVFLSRIFLAANWINPLAWVANRQAIHFREEACDESVLAAGHAPSAYAEMLFRQASQQNDRYLQTCTTSMAETGTIEQRIKMILKQNTTITRKPSHLAKLGAAGFTMLFVLIGFVGSQTATNSDSDAAIEKKLSETILPSVQFSETPLRDALAFLAQKGSGMNIILNAPKYEDAKITLRLTNVPLSEALRYTANLAQTNYRIDGNTILVEEISASPPTASAKIPEGNDTVAEKLKKIVIPSIEFRDTPLNDAIAFLAMKSVELDDTTADPKKKGVNIIINADKNTDALITLRLTNVSLAEALKYITSLAGLTYRVDEQAVVIEEKAPAPSGDLYTEAIGISGEAIALFRPVKDAKKFLESFGIRFGQGATAIYNQGQSKLIVRNTKGELDQIKAFIKAAAEGKLDQFKIEQGWEDVFPNEAKGDSTSKLDSIIIPKAEFNKTPFADVLDFLRQRSVELDAEEVDRANKGINMILEEAKRVEAETVTLKVTNISLGNVLRYAADQVGFKYTVEPNAVVFRPKD